MIIVEVAAGVLLLIGFICGYGVREFISRHRGAKARRRHFERLAEEVAQTRKLIRNRLPKQRRSARPSGGGSVMTTFGALLIGFVCGYGVRELISRRRSAEYRRRHPERYDRL
jgi:hypothetical protein